jgi:hypothetical protein
VIFWFTLNTCAMCVCASGCHLFFFFFALIFHDVLLSGSYKHTI